MQQRTRGLINAGAYISSARCAIWAPPASISRNAPVGGIILAIDGSRFTLSFQIADFGRSRDLMDKKYYVAHKDTVPIKWTAPEVRVPLLKLGWVGHD